MGLNGSGKSTLLKLMTGDLEPVDGMVKRHNHLKIGMYHQHLADSLPIDMNPLEYFVRRCSLPFESTSFSGVDSSFCKHRLLYVFCSQQDSHARLLLLPPFLAKSLVMGGF